MKKLLLIFTLAITGLLSNDAYSNTTATAAKTNSYAESKNIKLTRSDMNKINQRLIEIRAMDKNKLSLAQKAELKKELIQMKGQINKSGPILFFTLGALASAILILMFLV